jgi:hypothetical protein
MFAFALPALNFLRGNWTWALPAIGMAAALAWGGLERMGRLACRGEQASFAAKANAEVIAFNAADASHGAKLAGDYAAEVAGLQGDLQNAQIALARAGATKTCDRTPRSDAFDRGVRAGPGASDRHPDAAR